MSSLEEAMVAHVADLVANGPTQPEMRRVMAQTERDWFAELADTGDRADAVNEAVVVWGDPDHIQHQLEPWAELTPDAVARAAARWLAPDCRAVLEYVAEEA
jgi:predicted Zn-dependent peptidase